MTHLESAITKLMPPHDTAVNLTLEETQALYEYLIHQVNSTGRWVARTQNMSDYRRKRQGERR